MALTTGASFPAGTVFIQRNAGTPPYNSSAGNTYWIAGQSATRIGAFKKADPTTGTFAAVGTAPSDEGVTIACLDVNQKGDLLYCAWQLPSGLVRHSTFNMSTDTWAHAGVAGEQVVGAAAFAPTTNYPHCSLAVRSTDEIVCQYASGLVANMSSFNGVSYTRKPSGGSWQTPVRIDNGGSISYTPGPTVLGASDRVHFFMKDVTNSDLYQRALESDNTLQTWPSAFDATAQATNAIQGYGNGLRQDVGGVIKIRAVYADASGTAQALFDSAATPTITTEAINAFNGVNFNNQRQTWIDNDETTIYSLVSDGSSFDLMSNSSVNLGGAWSGSTTEVSLAAAQRAIVGVVQVGLDVLLASIDATSSGTPVFRYKVLRTITPPAEQPIRLVGMVGIRGAA